MSKAFSCHPTCSWLSDGWNSSVDASGSTKSCFEIMIQKETTCVWNICLSLAMVLYFEPTRKNNPSCSLHCLYNDGSNGRSLNHKIQICTLNPQALYRPSQTKPSICSLKRDSEIPGRLNVMRSMPKAPRAGIQPATHSWCWRCYKDKGYWIIQHKLHQEATIVVLTLTVPHLSRRAMNRMHR